MNKIQLQRYLDKIAKAIDPNYTVKVYELSRSKKIFSKDFAISAVCSISGISFENLIARNRHVDYVMFRSILAYILYNYCGLGYVQIGHVLDRDHSTIIQLVSKFNLRINSHPNPRYIFQYQQVKDRMGIE